MYYGDRIGPPLGDLPLAVQDHHLEVALAAAAPEVAAPADSDEVLRTQRTPCAVNATAGERNGSDWWQEARSTLLPTIAV